MAAKHKSKATAPFDAGAKKMDKTANFQRLANKRVNAALKKISLVGNLSNKATYLYTLEQVDKITAVLAASVDNTMARFRLAPTQTDQFTV